MTPAELLRNYSLEITARDEDGLAALGGRLRPAMPVSITFLPGDEMDRLAAIAGHVRALGLTPVPHISARRIRSAERLDTFLDALREAGATDRVFVVAGDPREPMGPYEDALAVIRSGKLAAAGVRQVGIAGYPEGHAQIPAAKLRDAMAAKLAEIAASGQTAEIVTQFSFDAEPVLHWLEELRQDGIETPVRIGLAGPASAKALLHFAARCGVEASRKVLSKYGLSLTRLLGTATPDRLIDSLAASLDPARHGEVHAHLYPFGGVAKAVDWAEDRVAAAAVPS